MLTCCRLRRRRRVALGIRHGAAKRVALQERAEQLARGGAARRHGPGEIVDLTVHLGQHRRHVCREQCAQPRCHSGAHCRGAARHLPLLPVLPVALGAAGLSFAGVGRPFGRREPPARCAQVRAIAVVAHRKLPKAGGSAEPRRVRVLLERGIHVLRLLVVLFPELVHLLEEGLALRAQPRVQLEHAQLGRPQVVLERLLPGHELVQPEQRR
eukprot:scaffold57901_cov66-Phaeocystis_antarctica.AAC.2